MNAMANQNQQPNLPNSKQIFIPTIYTTLFLSRKQTRKQIAGIEFKKKLRWKKEKQRLLFPLLCPLIFIIVVLFFCLFFVFVFLGGCHFYYLPEKMASEHFPTGRLEQNIRVHWFKYDSFRVCRKTKKSKDLINLGSTYPGRWCLGDESTGNRFALFILSCTKTDRSIHMPHHGRESYSR